MIGSLIPSLHTILQDPSTWFFIAFVLFFVIHAPRAWAALREILDQYAQDIRTQIQTADQQQQVCAQTLAEAHSQAIKAQAQAHAILQHASEEITHIQARAEQDIEHFRKSYAKLIDERIQNANSEAAQQICRRAIVAGTEAARFILQKEISPAQDAALVDQAIDALEHQRIL